jgi:hypothetical protein
MRAVSRPAIAEVLFQLLGTSGAIGCSDKTRCSVYLSEHIRTRFGTQGQGLIKGSQLSVAITRR